MKKILIISTSLAEQEMIEEVAQSHDPSAFSIETTGSFGQESGWWVQNSPDVLILNLPDDEALQGHFISKLKKDVPRSISLVVICPVISPALMKMSQVFQKLRIIKSPVSGFHLFNIVNESLKEYRVGEVAVHPRYLTDQSISVFSDMKTGRMKAQMKNLSVSGAYFESSEKGMALKKGELIRISVVVKAQKEYVFDCKLVWMKTINELELMGYGVTFVDKDEVYEALLKAL